ncbi:hypothetical protein PPL_08020 [Heterostelium album PN500]|uniref:Pyridoxal phosphate homeostasis protein n=1 Tax=Heterostelium pallidum (strain ATCC 26659 / Pp 5 / PN500) TaxID=670386 RepID=D3BHL7_HETP5|nr:hypothetical protein PPL_08020 [Heterostelium album PN500]EFA79194.1 hypothetical protein PPL_08020 [Heterostelium album PN500]|eukprot:XP_020431315.1 hypothetical protein PPL_08020 [Heterostelium album PN500]
MNTTDSLRIFCYKNNRVFIDRCIHNHNSYHTSINRSTATTTYKMDETEKRELLERYNAIKSKITDPNVTLVAVSKTKPSFMIRELYENGHRHFGENYIQELELKSKELEDLKDIKWHFIGSVQSNKIKQLGSVLNLAVVETVEKSSAADKFAKCFSNHSQPLEIMVQVNTSGEQSKSGCEPNEVVDIVKHIISDEQCKKSLKFSGLMTIGSPNATEDQPDFKKLFECRDSISKQLGLPIESIALSMGMSHDFVEAIKFGSTSVRVGSAIFGERDYSKK